MPPKARVDKEAIINAAVDIVREKGDSALNARSVAAKLGTSTQPIFSNYGAMEELKADVRKYAYELYSDTTARCMNEGRYPAYKASGMAYIQFAKQEKELFKLLFMRDRSGEVIDDSRDIQPIIDIIRENLGLNQEEALLFHAEMWVYVHGIAVLLATSYLDWGEELISRMLTDLFMGLRERYKNLKEEL